jgi:hypothetical protein
LSSSTTAQIERRLAPERGSARIRPYPHAVLRQCIEIDETSLGQRRKMLAQQPVEQIGAADPEICQRVMVHGHATAQPAIGIMAVAQAIKGAGAADPLAGGVEPKCQQKPRRGRRMTGPVAPRLDPILKLAQIEPHYVGPDHAREMVFPDQAVDIHRAQLDLVAFGLAKARRAGWCGFALWLCAFRELFKKLVASHRSPHANQPSQGITAGPASAMLQLSFAKDSQPRRAAAGSWQPVQAPRADG